MDAFGDMLFNFYGATETGLVTLAKPADLRAAPGTIGKALPGNEIRLLDERRARRATQGEVGELYVKNKMLVAGYHDDAAATRAEHDRRLLQRRRPRAPRSRRAATSSRAASATWSSPAA